VGEQVQIGHGHFDVLAIIRTSNGFEDGGVFMPLTTAQNFFHKQGVSSVATVKLKNKEDSAAFSMQYKRNSPISSPSKTKNSTSRILNSRP
jgi:putative ABC transport system permease protein